MMDFNMSGDSDGQYKWLILISSFVCTCQRDVEENPSTLEAYEELERLAISGCETRQEKWFIVWCFKSGQDF